MPSILDYMFGGGTARSAVTPTAPAYLTSALAGLTPAVAAGIPAPQFTAADYAAPINAMQMQGIDQLAALGGAGLGGFAMGAQGALQGLAQGQGANAGAFNAGLNTAQQYAQGAIPQQSGYRTGLGALTDVSRGVPGSAQAQTTLGTLASGGGVGSYGAPTSQRGLTDTAAGNYLYGGEGFNAALDAATRRILPAVGSSFGGSGRLRSGLAQEALGTGIADAFAAQYGAERALQTGAQNTLLNQQNVDRARQLQAAASQGGLANQTAGLQSNAANALLANNSDMARLGLAGADLSTNAALASRGQQLQAAGMAPQFEALRGLPAERLMQAGQAQQALVTQQAQAGRDARLTNNQLAQADLAARTANTATLAGATPIGQEQTTELPANPLAGLLGLGLLAGGLGGNGSGGLGSIGDGLGGIAGGVGDLLGGIFGDNFDLTGVLQNITGPVLGGLTGGLPGLPFNINDPAGGFDLTGDLGNAGGGGLPAGTPPATPPGQAQAPSTPSVTPPTGGAFNLGGNIVPIANDTIGSLTGGLPGATFNTGTPAGAFDLTGNLGGGLGSAPTGTANVAAPPGQFQMPSAPASSPPVSVPSSPASAPRIPQAPSTNPLTSVSVQPGGATNTVAGTAEFTGAGGGAAFNPASLTGATLTPIADSVIAGITGGLPGATFNAGAVPGAFELTGTLGSTSATGATGAGGGALGGLGASGALAALAPAAAFLAMTAGSRAERDEANSLADSWATRITEAQNAGRETVNVDLGGNTYTLRVGDLGDVQTGRWFQLANGQWLGIGAEGRPAPILSNAPPDVSSTATAPSYVQGGTGTTVGQLVTGQQFTPWQQGLPMARPGETMAEYQARMASPAYGGGGSGGGN